MLLGEYLKRIPGRIPEEITEAIRKGIPGAIPEEMPGGILKFPIDLLEEFPKELRELPKRLREGFPKTTPIEFSWNFWRNFCRTYEKIPEDCYRNSIRDCSRNSLQDSCRNPFWDSCRSLFRFSSRNSLREFSPAIPGGIPGRFLQELPSGIFPGILS